MTTRYLFLILVAGCMTSNPADDLVDDGVAAVTATCPTSPWCTKEDPPPVLEMPLLHSVFAIAADNVFAVGSQGTIWHRDSTAWSEQVSGTLMDLFAVWGASATDVWAGGANGILLHFDGTAWSPVAGGPTTDINSVWGSSATDVWFAGSTVATHWDGTAFRSFGLTGTLLSVSGTSPTDAWLAGENFQLRHFNGASWSTFSPSPGSASQALFTVLALGTTDVWVTDTTLGKETMHFGANKTWTAFSTVASINGVKTSTTFNSLAAVSSNDIWGAGQARIGHWNGSAWTMSQPFGNVSLHSISIVAGNGWIVGSGGLIEHATF